MEISVTDIVSGIAAITGIGLSLLYARKAKRAEVRAKEIENDSTYIGNADRMVELVKKATAEAAGIQEKLIETLKTENEKFSKTASRLERAIQRISLCPYRSDCPVIDELQNGSASCKGNEDERKNNRNRPRHTHSGQGRQGDAPRTA